MWDPTEVLHEKSTVWSFYLISNKIFWWDRVIFFSTTIRHLTIFHLTKMYFWSHSSEILKYLDEHKMCFLVPALPCMTEFHCFPFPFHFNSTQRAYNMSQKLENPQFLLGIFLLIYRLNIPVVGMFSVVVCTSLRLLSIVWRWLLFI